MDWHTRMWPKMHVNIIDSSNGACACPSPRQSNATIRHLHTERASDNESDWKTCLDILAPPLWNRLPITVRTSKHLLLKEPLKPSCSTAIINNQWDIGDRVFYFIIYAIATFRKWLPQCFFVKYVKVALKNCTWLQLVHKKIILFK